MTSRPLSQRAKHRLEIAAGPLRGMGRKVDFPGEQLYDGVQQILTTLTDQERVTVKELVPWSIRFAPGAQRPFTDRERPLTDAVATDSSGSISTSHRSVSWAIDKLQDRRGPTTLPVPVRLPR
uniref:Uncharacterized protein n=1 Tax=Burkholderia sp. (strain CCGE1003) TaxID=640512 RepID=E1TFC7_BURSG